MRIFACIGLIAFVRCAPQSYSGTQGTLDDGTLETIGDIFGNGQDNQNLKDGGYGNGDQTGKLAADDVNIGDILGGNGQSGNVGTGGVNVNVEVVQETNTYVPDDYVEPTGNLVDQATQKVDETFDRCEDYTESQGYECVPYYQCHNGTIITDGAGLIDIRNGFGLALNPEESKCEGFLDVCCKDPDFVRPPPPKIKYAPRCGQRHQYGLGARIQGFTQGESQFGEWPHMCAVLHETIVEPEGGYGGQAEQTTANLYQCGGSLIAPGVILTAAHCVNGFIQNPTELKIRCGEWDTQNETEPYPHQDRKVANLEIHPLFEPKNLFNDFALLFTQEDFVLASHIDTVCLPNIDEVFDNERCFATGWGKDQFGSQGEYQVVLKEIDLPVVNNYECQERFKQSRLGNKFKLHDSFICAGGEQDKDTCKGDGGSPLVCPSKNNPDTYVQAGIVAWGIGCGEGYPGAYAAVSKALCWVDYVMSCYQDGYSNIFPSFNGYTSNVCQPYMDNLRTTVNILSQKRLPQVLKQIMEGYINLSNLCNVEWPQPSGPLTDVSANQRDPAGGDNYSGDQAGGDNYSGVQTSGDQKTAGDNYSGDQTSGSGNLVKGDDYNGAPADIVEKVPEQPY